MRSCWHTDAGRTWVGRATGYGIKDEKMMRYRCRPVSRQLEKRMREKKLSGMEL